jgi:DNA replication and repair protein RecF
VGVTKGAYNNTTLRVEHLHLTNVRNIAQCDIEPSPGMNFLYGKNGHGKTNFVEAIYFLATLDFHRGQAADFISRGESKASISAQVEVDDLHRNIEITLEGKRRTVLVDGDPVRRVKDYLGRVLAVAFFPEDMQILLMEPALRRRWLDKLLTIYHIPYRDTLNRAKKALENRNQLLREPVRPQASLFQSVEAVLAPLAAEIMVRRREMVAILDEKLREIYEHDFDGTGEPYLAYEPSFRISEDDKLDAITSAYNQALSSGREKDLTAGITLVGPHRDDFILQLDYQVVRTHASRGEVRTALFCLNLAKVDILREKYNQAPIVILDDVLSELDAERRKKVLLSLPKGSQVFITSTEKEHNVLESANPIVFWKVEDGLIKPS